jgi:hypothetical protein
MPAEALCLGTGDAATDATSAAGRRLHGRLLRACRLVDLEALGFPAGACTHGMDASFDLPDLVRCVRDVHAASVEDVIAASGAGDLEAPL